jgi:CRISPR-associated endonuclease/helicase Cas3
MTPLPDLKIADFSAFFQECWGEEIPPFPWQEEFARRASCGDWPGCVAVPTGSGKTACLDAAVFALALQAERPQAQRTAGRRIFFIVNRRVIVDEAFNRARTLAVSLRDARPGSVMRRVADRLLHLAGTAPESLPLSVTELRGGIYRDRAWTRSLLQPTIICSTVDQAGSRLLFRGYGVSASAAPIHAALVSHDSVLIVDEAHISRPFIETLGWVRRYRAFRQGGSTATAALPFVVVPMTATPPPDVPESATLRLGPPDFANPVLHRRLMACKPAILKEASKATGRKDRNRLLGDFLAEEAQKVIQKHNPRSIAVMVNRVETARIVAEKLRMLEPTLLIGRMRPLDRDSVTERIQEILKTGAAANSSAAPLVVVSTQCLEVGADLDFDALVTEAASLDALRQRFGRLNRGGRAIRAAAVIVIPADQNLSGAKLNDAKPADPIYGNAVARTWAFLQGIAHEGTVDFGINSMTAAVDALSLDEREKLFTPTSSAPVMMPAYLDALVQTNPRPAADPDVGMFLHGPQRDASEVQVCWRADLPDIESAGIWSGIISLCPPASLECLPVPIHVFREWLFTNGAFNDDSGDVVQCFEEPESFSRRPVICFVWRGIENSGFISDPSEIRPGDTVVLRAQNGGWSSLGHVPGCPKDPAEDGVAALSDMDAARIDLASVACAVMQRRACLRIHPALCAVPPALLQADLDDRDLKKSEIQDMLRQMQETSDLDARSAKLLCFLTNVRLSELTVHPYPEGPGLCISASAKLPAPDLQSLQGGLAVEDTGDDPLLEAYVSQSLADHTADVQEALGRIIQGLEATELEPALRYAAELHDWGKCDPRFQALLRGSALFAASGSGPVLAKSAKLPQTAEEANAARRKAGLPRHWRHETASVLLAELAEDIPAGFRDLILHLISSHHGYGRPFVHVTSDDTPPALSMSTPSQTVLVSPQQRLKLPAHRVDSGIAERFWLLTRRYGWWGLPFLETVLRLADQEASAHPST